MPHPKKLEAYEPWIHQILEEVWETKQPLTVPMPSRAAATNWRQRIYTYRKIAMKEAPEIGAHRFLTIQIRLEEVPGVGSVLILDPLGSGQEYFAAAFEHTFGKQLEGWGNYEEEEPSSPSSPSSPTGDPMYSEIAARAREEVESIDVAAMIRSLGASRDESETPPKAATTPLAGDPPEAAASPPAATYCPHPSWEYNHLIDARVCSRCGKPEPASPASPRPEAGN